MDGKIYQMKNAAGTENRFPRTVIEAVYGLSSYLQQQFASLADIYMPIEGISEALTGQEFVYRISPNTIKAKSLTLDKILGKTLAWNQRVNCNGVNASYGSVSDKTVNGFTGTANASSLEKAFTLGSIFTTNNHKYYFGFDYTSNLAFNVQDMAHTNRMNATTTFVHFSTVSNRASSGYSSICWYLYSTTTATWNLVVRNCIAVNLTLMFGEGKEPTAEDFEKYYLGSYEPSAGTLISNDASAIETVGFNQWDEEWENGRFEANVGSSISYISDNDCIRSKTPQRCFPNTEYYIHVGGSYNVKIAILDADGIVVASPGSSDTTNRTYLTPANAYYFVLYYMNASNPTYNHDICINLSDASRNGQYEPYWKRTLSLGLNSFKVKDDQGNVITITGGLKSAGSIYDEIVGNKYIKRVGSVDLGSLTWALSSSASNVFYTTNNIGRKIVTGEEWFSGNGVLSKYILALANVSNWTANINTLYSTDKSYCLYNGRNNTQYVHVHDSAYSDVASFKAAMSGVILYYELATPIEYELVEPLVPTVKAGTTEARVSPNADGLSAPFRADITYSAQENNDSASSQYAAVAGRLLNPQTIWGQTFDGSSPVSGSLSGVQNIAMAGNITGAVNISARALTHPSGDFTLGNSDNDDFINIMEDTNVKQQFRLEKGAKFGTSSNLLLEWDATNNALRFHGNFIADGFGSFGGVQPSNSEIFCAAVLGPANYQFVNVAGIVDGPNEEYFVPPSSDAIADGNIDRAHVFATKADIDALSARITALGG